MAEDTIPEMRERIDQQNKDLASAKKTNADLAAENRRLLAREAFGTAGYQAAHGDLFAREHPEGDITPESISEFVGQYNLTPAGAGGDGGDGGEGETTSDEGGESGDTGEGGDLSSMSRGGSRPGDGGQSTAGGDTLTRDEWKALKQRDPAAAHQAVTEGRVQIRTDNPYAVQRS